MELPAGAAQLLKWLHETSRDALDELADEIGTRTPFGLFTILTVDWSESLVRRLYSTNEKDYPSGGTKKLMGTSWGTHVLINGSAFFASTPEDMASAFADHELLASLGLHKALNVPIRQQGLTCFSLNLLRAEPAFDPYEGVAVIQAFERWRTKHIVGR